MTCKNCENLESEIDELLLKTDKEKADFCDKIDKLRSDNVRMRLHLTRRSKVSRSVKCGSSLIGEYSLDEYVRNFESLDMLRAAIRKNIANLDADYTSVRQFKKNALRVVDETKLDGAPDE